MHRTLKFVLTTAGATLLIGGVGGVVAGPDGREAAWLGAAAAFAIQVALFLIFFVVVFASKPLLAHGMGMLGRLIAVGGIALIWVPWAGVPAAPLLLSMVTVLFVTTLAEPLFILGVARER